MYQNGPTRLKAFISIEKRPYHPYGTIFVQTQETKRVTKTTASEYFLKKWRLAGLWMKKEGVQSRRHDVVKDVRTYGDAESSDCEQAGEIDAGRRAKAKSGPSKLVVGAQRKLSFEENVMMVSAE